MPEPVLPNDETRNKTKTKWIGCGIGALVDSKRQGG